MDIKRDFKGRFRNKEDIVREFNKLPPEKKMQFEKLKNDILKYQGKDKNELMNELRAMVQKGKREGTISNEMIDQFKRKVAPMLDPEQRKNLESIVNMLKGKQG
ncbi:MAG TPA: hypothetical protein PLZ84_05090 [Clostridia bacterium]|nr:hypothetical protein [Clostridia bacterium]